MGVNLELLDEMYVSFAPNMQHFNVIFAIAGIADLELMLECSSIWHSQRVMFGRGGN